MNYSIALSSSSSQVTSTTLEKHTQTDKEKRASLSDRDISFLKEFRRSHKKRPRKEEESPRKKECDTPRIEETIGLPPEQILDFFDDPLISDENLELHLSAMFNDQPTPTLDSSFPEQTDEAAEQPSNQTLPTELDDDYDPEIKQLLLDIDENHRLLKTRSAEQQEVHIESPSIRVHSTKQNENTRKELMKSIWPCKLYHHRKQLQENLLLFSDQNSRNADLIKQRFLELFGEDSDDDIGAFSPSHDMDSELLLSSSKKRVAPMVVQHLMEPFKKGLVGDKAAFKSMAQDFTECIIANDIYPSFLDVKGVIDGFFDDGQEDADIDINVLLQ